MTKELVYAFDPLCGWCYGFGGALRALRKARPDLRIALRMGGLVTGERIGPYSAAAEYIRAASARMTAVTGAALGAGRVLAKHHRERSRGFQFDPALRRASAGAPERAGTGA